MLPKAVPEQGLTIVGALFPVQAFLYAKVVTTFQLTGADLVSRGNFWSLMWFVLAILVGLAYFGVGWAGTAIGEVRWSCTLAHWHRH